MKEYDIYIKNRLTESKIIVYSIPYRDGVSAVNRIMMEAMLDYYTLQKFIATAIHSEMVSEIDEMLATVYEIVGDSVLVQVDAAFLARYQNEIKRTAIEIGISDLDAFCQSFLETKNKICWQSSNPESFVKASLDYGESAVEIQGVCTGDLKHPFLDVKNDIGIAALETETGKEIFEHIQSAIGLSFGETNLLRRYTAVLECAVSIAESIISIETHYSLGDGISRTAVVEAETGNTARKNIKISHEIQVFCDIAGRLMYFVAIENGTEVIGIVSSGLKRYRKLNETDSVSLADIDEMSLNEWDYVTLTND